MRSARVTAFALSCLVLTVSSGRALAQTPVTYGAP